MTLHPWPVFQSTVHSERSLDHVDLKPAPDDAPTHGARGQFSGARYAADEVGTGQEENAGRCRQTHRARDATLDRVQFILYGEVDRV